MNKPASLRQALEAALPELRDNPDRLLMFIEDGGIVAAPGRLSFGYRYTVKLIVTDFAGHLDQLIIPLRGWIEANEPPLIQNPERLEKGFRFEAELTSLAAMDVEITLQLTERVRVTAEGEGNFTATHLGEAPDPYSSGERWIVTVKDEVVYDSGQA